MHLVATLISARARPALDHATLERVMAAIGTDAAAPVWLEPDIAADITLPRTIAVWPPTGTQ